MSAVPVRRGVLPARDDAGLWLGIAGLAACAAVLGLLAARSPLLAIGFAVALTFVGFVMADVTTGFLLFTFVAFLEVIPGVGGGLSFAKIAGLTLLLSWLAATTTANARSRSFVSEHPYATALIVLFLTWTAASAIWAQDQGTVFGAFFRYAPNRRWGAASGPWWVRTQWASASARGSSRPAARARSSSIRRPSSTWPSIRPSSLMPTSAPRVSC